MSRVKLPKRPLLLVRGRSITPEQADVVILRTAGIASGVHCNEERWNKRIRRIFGITANPYTPEGWEQWERAAAELGALDLRYIHNDLIATCNVDGPTGWVNWGGQVFCRGMTLADKWPTIEDVTCDWREIARAFPFLDLRAQLVEKVWDEDFERIKLYRPLIAWRIANGAVELKDDPGEPLFSPPKGTLSEHLERHTKGFPPEWGVRERRLRAAVQRCRRRTARRR